MAATEGATTTVATHCPLCVSRCGAKATLDGDGAFVALGPDPSHPTGRALCVKGKAAPQLAAHPDRLRRPLRRTSPKGAADPGWEEIGWEQALDAVASTLRRVADEDGAEAVLFSTSSPSTTAIVDAIDWVSRLRRAFGSPNHAAYMELCGWGRYFSSLWTFGAPVPGEYMPDLDHAGAILYWGYNPSVARLAHATATVAAVRRGARLVVVDPRRAGLASRADAWLRVRPGSDGALALAMTHVMLDRGWFDRDFVLRWTNAPFLVAGDGRLLRASDLDEEGDPSHCVAWDDDADRPVVFDPGSPEHLADRARLATSGRREVTTVRGPVTCRPVLDLVAEGCAAMAPSVAEGITGVPARQIEDAARLLWESRPVAFYTWSGLEQHANATQTLRAIQQLYALTGSFDQPGGNVLFTKVPTNRIDGMELLAPEQRAKAVGLDDRPIGPARFEFVTGEDVYRAMLDAEPYRLRALVNFGANLVMAHGDSARGRDALASLDFMVHLDLFMSPTAELADIVLPVTSAFEAEGLKVGFEISQEAQGLVQLRRPVAPRVGEARSDLEVIFDLAVRLGLDGPFFGGDVEAGWRHQLEPSGITLEQLRAQPEGVRLPLQVRHRKFADLGEDGAPVGFRTPSRRIELYSEELAAHGHSPLPTFTEPGTTPRSDRDLGRRYPLTLTCAKSLHFCETQHRNLAPLRGSAPEPELELHPEAAADRGVAAGDWVRIDTPHGAVRARARLNPNLDPAVVVGQHGWWQACDELDLPGYPAFGPASANLNLVLQQQPSDPISGSSPLRSAACEVTPLR